MSEPTTLKLRETWIESVTPLFPEGDLTSSMWGDTNLIPDLRRAVCITQQRKCDYLSNLHDIVARRCPRNKVGAPVVSDYDKISATFDEHLEALACVVDPKLRRKVV